MCVCSRTPRARANSAVSAISSWVTLNGEQGASAIRSIEPGRGIMELVERVVVGGEDRVAVLDHGVRRQPAVRHAQVHRAAARVEADAELPRGLDLDRQQIARAVREDVVVIGGGRAARAQQRRQPRACRRALDPGVDPRPGRVQLDQPFEQRRVLREPARRPLVEVVVAVDQAGRREAAGRVDPRAVDAVLARRPTAVIRLPSTTMCPSWWTGPLTVAIAQPSMITASPV